MHVPQTTINAIVRAVADVALRAVINIQSLKLYLNAVYLIKIWRGRMLW